MSFSWNDVSGCQRSEIVRLREVAKPAGTSASVHMGRYLDLVEGTFMIPSLLRCDRLFLIAADDAKYVESVVRRVRRALSFRRGLRVSGSRGPYSSRRLVSFELRMSVENFVLVDERVSRMHPVSRFLHASWEPPACV